MKNSADVTPCSITKHTRMCVNKSAHSDHPVSLNKDFLDKLHKLDNDQSQDPLHYIAII
jgi:hypothetical protein